MKYLLALCLMLPTSIQAADWVVILVDTSSSMNEPIDSGKSRIEATKEALMTLVQDIPQSTYVGLLTFDGWKIMPGPVDKDVLTKVIRNLSCDGGTPLGYYTKIAADELLKRRSIDHQGGMYKLVVATDGEPNDPDLLKQYLPDIAARQINIDAVGIGVNGHSISTMVDHYYNANDASSLKTAVKKAIQAEVSPAKDSDSFEDIAGIPSDVALGLIHYVTEVHNQPIGEKVRMEPVVENGQVTFVNAPAQPVEEEGSGWIIAGVIILFVVVVGAIFIVKSC